MTTPRFITTLTDTPDGFSVITEFPDNPTEAVYQYTPAPTPRPVVAVFGRLCKLPGNCSIGVSHDVFVRHGEDRGKGYGRIAHKERLRVAREHCGFSSLICTVYPTNAPQLRILESEGWECMGMVDSVLLYKKEFSE